MDLYQTPFEKAAIRAYFEDAQSSSDEDEIEAIGGEIEMKMIESDKSDLQFEGGARNKKK